MSIFLNTPPLVNRGKPPRDRKSREIRQKVAKSSVFFDVFLEFAKKMAFGGFFSKDTRKKHIFFKKMAEKPVFLDFWGVPPKSRSFWRFFRTSKNTTFSGKSTKESSGYDFYSHIYKIILRTRYFYRVAIKTFPKNSSRSFRKIILKDSIEIISLGYFL